MDNSNSLPSVLSLCTGYGGIERGLELAGFEHRVIAHVEIEAYAAANLVAKMEQGRMVPAPIWTDLKTLPVDCFRDRVELITGGYPCQPFSAAGKRAGKDDPRHLWPWIREHIQAIRPFRCFFENVEGHISLGLREVIEDLEGLGYATTWGIFSAAEVGAPHQRKRVYILAHSSSRSRGHSKGFVRGQDYKTKRSQNTDKAARSSENVADANDPRRQQSNQSDARQSSEQSNSTGLSSGRIPNSDGQGLEGRLYGSSDDSERRQEQEVRRTAECSDRRRGDRYQEWPPEPGLGRVVDGCADRVDRLRLLGNGVVPQTAAQAWITLNKEMQVNE